MFSLQNTAWQTRAVWTRFTSLFKRDWTIADYPIRVWRLPATEPSGKSRFKPLQWTAQVFNWPGISGNANSKVAALEELRRNFDRYKAANPNLPRPGTKVPIEFAANERVRQHAELANDFAKRVLNIEWAWISDESSLWDFHGDETNESLVDKIHDVYGVDVSDIADGNLADIFGRISERRTSANA